MKTPMKLYLATLLISFHTYSNEIMANNEFFKNKIILAPMVRMNTLPFRLLALEQGADIVFSEEIVDHKILRSERKYNDVLDTIDYVDKEDGTLVFRTCSKEKGRIIFQIGTSCPERAARCASIIQQDVAGIDINMGCPKHFSVSGGMGVALLRNRTNAQKIIEYVRKAVNIPVTCKIRVLNVYEDTISFCKLMEESGVSAISVHGRTPSERPRHPNRNSMLKMISEELAVPFIVNGGSNNIETYQDIIDFKEETNGTSVMIARAAQYNCNIFNKNETLPLEEIIKRYITISIDYSNIFYNTKYCIQSMLRELQSTDQGKLFLESQSMEQISEIWGLGDYYRKKQQEYGSRGVLIGVDACLESPRKKMKLELNDTLTLCGFFNRNNYELNDLPKTVLLNYAVKTRRKPPQYEVRNFEKKFQAIVNFNGKKYASSRWSRNKKEAEQEAALVCLCYLKLYDENDLRTKGIIL